MIQVIPKTKIKRESPFKQLLPWLSFLLIIVVFVLYFIFNQQIGKAEVRLEKVKDDLAQAKTEKESILEERIKTFKTKVDDVIPLLQRREKASTFFEFLEAFVHPRVYFSTLHFDSSVKKASLEGVADNFTSLGQQIFAFEQEPSIAKVQLSSVSLGKEGNVKFHIELFLAQKSEKE